MSTRSKSKSSVGKTYKRRSGVYKTPEGTYQAQKMVNGKRYNKTFKLKREAIAYITRFDAMIERFGKDSYNTKG